MDTHSSASPSSSRQVRRRWRADRAGTMVGTAVLMGLLALAPPSQAAVFTCLAGDVACLIDAIHAANTNGEANTITLAAGTYTLTAVNNDIDGRNGLPSITSTLTITGAGAKTTIIERNVSALPFRIIRVAPAGTLTLNGLTIRHGQAGFGGSSIGGGGIFNSDNGTVILTNSTLADNRGGTFGGGGIFNSRSGTATLVNSILVRNLAESGSGGGLRNIGAMTLTNTTLIDNRAFTIGGGLENLGTVTIINSTIAGNYGVGGAGLENRGVMTLTNTTLTDNHAGDDGGGRENLGTVTIINSTIADNTARFLRGGGLSNGGGTVELQNSIVAHNTAGREGPDCGGPVTSLGHNLIGDPTGCTIALRPSDLIGDPGVGAFTDDGTPGHGHVPLLSTSRAIDAGDDDACPETDQLGHPRVESCDIGAVEF
jgi:hypothetical protein